MLKANNMSKMQSMSWVARLPHYLSCNSSPCYACMRQWHNKFALIQEDNIFQIKFHWLVKSSMTLQCKKVLNLFNWISILLQMINY